MKIAISLPDDLFVNIESCARQLRMSRSRWLALAAREYLAHQPGRPDATEGWNRAIDRAGQPGADPAARAFMKRTKSVVRGGPEGKRW